MNTTRLPTATADDKAFIERLKIDQSLHKRITVERAIMRRTIAALLAAGYMLRVYDGEEWACDLTVDPVVVMDALMSTDEDKLYVWRKHADGGWQRVGWVYFVYGNSGYEVIADHTTNLSDVLKPVDDYADAIAEIY